MNVSNRQISRLLRIVRTKGPGAPQAEKRLRSLASRMTAEDWQRWFNGSESGEEVGADGRRRKVIKRRALDGRIWDAMTAEQREAANAIGKALEIITSGVGYKTNSFAPGTGGGEEKQHDWEVVLISRYLGWATEAREKSIDVGAAVAILCLGNACAVVDRNNCKRNGWAKQNLLTALDLYVRRQKWRFSV